VFDGLDSPLLDGFNMGEGEGEFSYVSIANCYSLPWHRLKLGCDCSTIVNDFVKCLPQFAKLLDSDDNFRVVRRFGAPAVRIFLHRQSPISRAYILGTLSKA